MATDESDVEGHRLRYKAQPGPDQEPDVEGHSMRGKVDADRVGVTPADEPDVEGHGFRIPATDQPQPGDEPETAGHMHPDTARAIGAARQEEWLARADRDRQAKTATAGQRDGGMLDKIKRFAGRED